jgi:dihydropteroate synthase
LVHPPYDKSVYLTRLDDTSLRVWLRTQHEVVQLCVEEGDLRDWAESESPTLATFLSCRLDQPKPAQFAGFALDRPLLMGILNVTPNSFSDGGRFVDRDAAIAHGKAMAAAGADIIDVGGESTRPFAEPVSPAEEMARIGPVVAALAEAGLCVSIDSRHEAVMQCALERGARIINDITSLTGDPGSLALAVRHRVPVVLMHMQGEPQTMQKAPLYRCAPLDIYDYLAERIAACVEAGLPRDHLCVDPGIGFGKSTAHNRAVLANLDLFTSLGVPVLLGLSRKSVIGALSKGEPADQRLAGSLAGALAGLRQGVQILRVHDVAETAQAVAVWRAIEQERADLADFEHDA